MPARKRGVTIRISSAEGMDGLKKRSDGNAELRVLYYDICRNAPGETDARIIVTSSNELEVAREGFALMKATLNAAEFFEFPESTFPKSKFVATLEVKFRDGKSLGLLESR